MGVEGSRRESVLVHEIRNGGFTPGKTDAAGLGDFGGSDDDAIAFDGGCAFLEKSIAPSDFEMGGWLAIAGSKPGGGVVELDADRIAFDGVAGIERAIVGTSASSSRSSRAGPR
jgi:hypothetical protein